MMNHRNKEYRSLKMSICEGEGGGVRIQENGRGNGKNGTGIGGGNGRTESVVARFQLTVDHLESASTANLNKGFFDSRDSKGEELT